MTQRISKSQIENSPTSEAWREVGAVGEPAFLNGWQNYGGGWTTCAFYKDIHGIVHLKGLVRNGTALTDIFTLPVGYRPLKITHFVAVSAQTTPQPTGNISPDGDVKQRTGLNGYFSLDGKSFRAEA